MEAIYNDGEKAYHQYHQTRCLDDLNRCISNWRHSVLLTSHDHEATTLRYISLAAALRSRYGVSSAAEDMEEAASYRTHAHDLMFSHFPEVPAEVDSIVNLLDCRFDQSDNLADLEESITIKTRMLALMPDNHPDKPQRHSSLGASLWSRFEKLRNLADLEEAITHETHALHLTPDSHPGKPIRHSALGASLWCRFEERGNIADLEEAVDHETHALRLTSDNHPDKARRHIGLGTSLWSRFEKLGNIADLEEAITHETHALHLTPDSHPDKPHRHSTLGTSLWSRFKELGNLADLEEAIIHHTHAVRLTADSDSDKPNRHNNLGVALWSRFERLGKSVDIEQAITHYTSAVSLATDGHPEKPLWHSNLGVSLQSRFDRLGDVVDLEEAVTNYARAVSLTHDSHPEKPRRHSNLGVSLWSRFERLGSIADLEEAITHNTHAVNITSDGHPEKAKRHNNLGMSLWSLFNNSGSPTDLEQAITHETHALNLTPDGHPEKSLIHSNLGVFLWSRFERLGDSVDLEAAITHNSHAISLTPDGHPAKAQRLNNLGRSLNSKYNLQRAALSSDNGKKDSILNICFSPPIWYKSYHLPVHNCADLLQDAIQCLKQSLDLTSDSDPQTTRRLILLSNLLAQSNQPYDVLQAAQCLSEAMQHKNSAPLQRMEAGHKYVDMLTSQPSVLAAVHEQGMITLLQAHKHILDLVPQLVWLGHDITRRFQELLKLGTLSNRAAADAIAAGEFGQALEWLESGRTVVWAQVLQLRTPLEDLHCSYPELAGELEVASLALERASMPQVSKWFSHTKYDTLQVIKCIFYQAGSVSLHGEANTSYRLALNYEAALAKIREKEDFKDFLQPKRITQLASACVSGPVVVINVHVSRCDALILHQSKEVTHIPLTAFSYNHAKKLQQQLWDVLDKLHLRARFRDGHTEELGVTEEDRGGHLPYQRRSAPSILRSILANLWTLVAKPVLDVMVSCLFCCWCPCIIKANGLQTDL